MAARASRSVAAEDDAWQRHVDQIRDDMKQPDEPRTEIIEHALRRPNDVQVNRNLEQALMRIGKKDDQRARWLLDFAAQDMASISEGKRLDLAWDILRFATVPQMRNIRLERDRSGVISVPVEEIHQWLSDGIRTLSRGVQVRQDGPFDIEMPSSWRIDAELSYRLSWGGDRLVDDSAPLSDIRARFAAEVYRVLLAAGTRFRLCPKCDTPFIAGGRQKFCSARCSQAVRTRRYRANNADKARTARFQTYGRSLKKAGIKGRPQQRQRPVRRRST